jgi:hypothetical protein
MFHKFPLAYGTQARNSTPVFAVKGALLCLLPFPQIVIVLVAQSMSEAFTLVTSLRRIPESASSEIIAL